VKYHTARRIKRIVAGAALFFVANLSWGIVTNIAPAIDAGVEISYLAGFVITRMFFLTVIGYLALTVWKDYAPRGPIARNWYR
jgi:hypothetical protein